MSRRDYHAGFAVGWGLIKMGEAIVSFVRNQEVERAYQAAMAKVEERRQ